MVRFQQQMLQRTRVGNSNAKATEKVDPSRMWGTEGWGGCSTNLFLHLGVGWCIVSDGSDLLPQGKAQDPFQQPFLFFLHVANPLPPLPSPPLPPSLSPLSSLPFLTLTHPHPPPPLPSSHPRPLPFGVHLADPAGQAEFCSKSCTFRVTFPKVNHPAKNMEKKKREK